MSKFELGFDDGYEYARTGNEELFYSWNESEDFKRGFRAGMKEARKESSN